MGEIRDYVERAERLVRERDEIGAALSELGREVKAAGYDWTTIRRLATVRARGDEGRLAKTIARLQRYAEAAGVQLDLGLEPPATAGPEGGPTQHAEGRPELRRAYAQAFGGGHAIAPAIGRDA